ncbi:hypothetical protein BCR22_08865 [Enterococcus plantarum]|uniref:hypothetical protein n=1 Tax=Enterococcus plantarum TaxID=1077675 RepID=UPI00084D023A|nr:hypothetical protein [Enterococcus plantarum]OEG20035.1 hypothetical protein BCR22_08865 [Enterococcus plantarum]
MDELLKKMAAFGVPGIVLVVAISVSGYAGGVAITVALASLGPFGMIGGIATLGVIGLISHTIADYGTEKVIQAVVKEQLKKKEQNQIIKEIWNYPITKGLKLKVINYVENTKKDR